MYACNAAASKTSNCHTRVRRFHADIRRRASQRSGSTRHMLQHMIATRLTTTQWNVALSFFEPPCRVLFCGMMSCPVVLSQVASSVEWGRAESGAHWPLFDTSNSTKPYPAFCATAQNHIPQSSNTNMCCVASPIEFCPRSPFQQPVAFLVKSRFSQLNSPERCLCERRSV